MPAAAPRATGDQTGEDVGLRYVANGAIRVRGSFSGRTYAFSVASPVQRVDPLDATALVRTGLFSAA